MWGIRLGGELMEELLKEIQQSLKTRQNGVKYCYYDWKNKQHVECIKQPDKGIGTKAYTLRRINMLEDKLKELKKDLNAGKYDFKGRW